MTMPAEFDPPPEPQRAGATVDPITFEQAPIGWLPKQIDASKIEPTSVAGRALKAHQALAEAIVRPIHNTNEIIREARLKNQEPALADPRIEQQQHAQLADQLTKLEREVADLELQSFAEAETLAPFGATQTPLEEMRDQERRAAFARMTKEQRDAAIRRPNFAKAILGSDAELSGMTPAEQVMLREAELASRRPNDVQRLLVDKVVLDVAKVSLAAARKAIEANAVKVGHNKPTPKPTPPNKWR